MIIGRPPKDKPVHIIFTANAIESISEKGKFSNVTFHETTQNQVNLWSCRT